MCHIIRYQYLSLLVNANNPMIGHGFIEMPSPCDSNASTEDSESLLGDEDFNHCLFCFQSRDLEARVQALTAELNDYKEKCEQLQSRLAHCSKVMHKLIRKQRRILTT